MNIRNEIYYIDGGMEFLSRVKPLWEKLNNHHLDKSTHFSEHFACLCFEERSKKLLEKIHNDNIYIVIAAMNSIECGYCICTLDNEGTGEIDSIYADVEFRGSGIGDGLMCRALDWLKSKDPKQITLSVAAGNEEVFEFYKRYGFYPKLAVLKYKEA